jgi:hypothetical protein
MSASTLKLCLGLAGWSGMLLASLSVARLPGDWGHGICGAWGCGPPTQALVACHLAWLVALTPPVAFIMYRGRRAQWRAGSLLTVLSIAALLALIAYQRMVWWPEANEWQRSFFWQRCGFCLATSVDVPILQMLGLGLLLLCFAPSRRWQKESPHPGEHETTRAAPGQDQPPNCHQSWRGQ